MRKTIKRTYSVDDFVSKDGFLTSVWGPMLWTYLHTMSFNYPINPTKQDKKHYRDFIINLKFVMPCKYCRINLIKNFKHLPLTQKHMKNRESFSKYVYDLHELVNKMLKKTSGLTFDDIRERYENFRSRCTIDDLKIVHLSKIVKTRKTKKENGCTEPLYGKKSRCVIKIVPQEQKGQTMQIDKKCVKKKINHE